MTALAPHKLWVFGGLAVLAIGALLSYGHSRYNAGIKNCQDQYASSIAEYEKKIRKDERQRAEKALKQEADVSKRLAQLSDGKRIKEDEARRLARESNRTSECNLSNNELLYYEEAVRSTQ